VIHPHFGALAQRCKHRVAAGAEIAKDGGVVTNQKYTTDAAANTGLLYHAIT
jgi:hypothetical protein